MLLYSPVKARNISFAWPNAFILENITVGAGEPPAMIASRVRRPAFNVLVSGDFGWEPDLLAGLVTKYSRGGRIPHILFYLANGPAARHWQGQIMDGFGSRMSPEEFRQKIAGDTLFQQSFQHLAARLVPLACLIGKGHLGQVRPDQDKSRRLTAGCR